MFEYISGHKKERQNLFIKLLEGRLQVLYKISYSYFRNKDSASDAVQDSVLIAYKNMAKLKDMDKFNSWITTILVNRCRDIVRKSNKINFEEYDENVLGISKYYLKKIDHSFENIETRLDIIKYLQRIDDKYSEVIRLKYLGDYTIEEIATIMNIPQGTVKSRLNTGIKKLKGLMEVKRSVV